MSSEPMTPEPGKPMAKPSTAEIRPLGLPYGSVRALLSLMVLGMVVIDVLVGRNSAGVATAADDMVEVLWSECLVIVMAGYFTTRKFVRLPNDVVERLEKEGVLAVDRPLGLPRFTMRVVLILAFVALAVHMWRENRLFETKSAQVLGLALAFLLGGASAVVARFFGGGLESAGRLWWENLKAVLALGSVAACMVASLAFGLDHLPTWATSITIWMVLFYFGSR